MLGRIRVLVPVALLFFLAALLSSTESRVFARGSSGNLPDVAQQSNGSLVVDLAVQPEAVAPGEPLVLLIRMSNNSPFLSYPTVKIILPDTLTIDFNFLLPGLTYNLQTGTLTWTPSVAPNGGEAQIEIPLSALVAETRHPEQEIAVEVTENGTPVNTFSIPFWLGVPPSATISFSPPQVSIGQPVRIVGHVDGPGPMTQLWSLGDGRIVEATDPEVVYSAPGIYEVTLQASNPLRPVTATGLITVVSQAIAKFDVSDSTPAVGLPVNFINKSGGQQPISYLWDFGDGITSTESNPVHSYSSPGQYMVHLTAQNEIGLSEAYYAVEVGSAPIADFIIQNLVEAGVIVEAQAFFDDTVTLIEWDMGDGRQYEEESIRHVYWSSGDHLVTIRASNKFGETIVQRVVSVQPGKIYLYLPLVLTDGNPTSIFNATVQDTNTVEPIENSAQISLEALDLPADMSITQALFAYINEARRLNQLPALEFSPELSVAAQAHSDDMALEGFTGHKGSDGSSPSTRMARAQYRGGYAGEATAWGMQNAVEPVQYWLASPAHRDIILNPLAKEVGVGFAEDYSSSSVWYWTAEFGSPNLPQVEIEESLLPDGTGDQSQPNPDEIIPLGPPQDSEFVIGRDSSLIFTWQRTTPLAADERFGIYLQANGRVIRIGSVAAGLAGGQYEFKVATTGIPASSGENYWQIRLEKGGSNNVIQETPLWRFILREASQTPETQPSSNDTSVEPTVTPVETPTTDSS